MQEMTPEEKVAYDRGQNVARKLKLMGTHLKGVFDGLVASTGKE